MMKKQDAIFILTIDTEEEWHWENEFPESQFSVNNVDRLPQFQAFCDKLGIRPTYFVDYAVADNAQARDIMRDVNRAKTSEIGAHLHPWCNPPYYGKTTEFESHVVNLPKEQVVAKLDNLTERLVTEFSVIPRSFRSGRWGIDSSTLALLASRGYTVDSSVYPFYKNEFFTCEGSPNIPYWPDFNDPLAIGEQRDILEIPVSAGFNRSNFTIANTIHNALASPAMGWTKTVGFLWHTNILKKLYLSPELTTTADMCSLINTCLHKRHPVIHMYLHSSSLIDNATGLLDKNNAFDLICKRIEETFLFLQKKANIHCATISEGAALLKQTPTTSPVLTWQPQTF